MSDVLLFMGGGGGGIPVLTNLQGWWKADAGVYSDAGTTACVDNDPVYQWSDQSGNGRHFSQSNAAYRPTFKTGIVNAKPVIRFSSAGATDAMTNGYTFASFATASEFTFFSVAKWSNAGSLWSETNNYVIQYHTGTTIDDYNNDGTYDIAQKACALSTWVIVTYQHFGGVIYTGVNDTRAASLGSTASGNTAALSGAPVLGYNFSIGSNPFNGDVAEIAAYNVGLGEENRKSIERYLAAKYGISLPY